MWKVHKKYGKNQMHLVFKRIASMEKEESDKNSSKTEKRNRNEGNRRQIVDFIADNVIYTLSFSNKSSITTVFWMRPL